MSKKDMFFLVNKGSIAIDGISLTIGNILENKIRIFLIEHTINKTNLITRKAGDHVNVEFDIILKMASKVSMPKNILTKEFLEICGY